MNRDEHRLRKAWRSAWLYLCLSVFICGLSFRLSAQNVNPQSLYGRDTTQGVYVRDSAVAVEKFALAERMEHLREWDKAADIYQEILRSYADRVVPSQTDKDNKIYQYTSVTPAVQERLAKWPEEGLAVYRGRFEGEAAALLESAGDDPAQLHRIVSLYFITDTGRRAGLRLIDLYLERGEFPAGAWIGDQLLKWHPSLGDDRPKLIYRTALAYHLAGNDEQAQARFKNLTEAFPKASGTVRGGEVVLADSLAQELKATPARLRDASPDSWPMPFGAPDRARIPTASGFGGARLFGIELTKPTLRGIPSAQRRELEQQDQRDRASGLMTGIFPVVDRGEMFFQDNARVYAVSLESGLPLPGWAETYDGDRNGRFSTNAWPSPRSQQSTLCLTADSVLAIMGQSDVITMQFTGGYGQRDTKLVCLDRRTGKLKWSMLPKQLPESAANLRNVDLLGSPLAVGDTVYVQARGGKGMQFEDAYVLAFESAGGKFKWACYIASANTNSQMWDGDVNSILGQNVSHLAYASGRLYALTNLGALGAVDAYDGTIIWLNIYPRDVIDPGRNMGMAAWNRARIAQSSGNDKPWTYNPVIVSQGKVFTLPADGLNVHVYDAGSGIELKRIKLSQFDNARTMLGVVDDKLIVNNDRQVFCIDWPHYDPGRKRNENLVWMSNAFQRSGAPDDSIRGRGLVTSDSVIIPTAWQLYRLSMRSGSLVESYPPGDGRSWNEDEGPGNVMVTQDRLIVAGPGSVNVYTDLAMAMAKLEAAIAAAPQDPNPRLRSAEILFVAGKLGPAVAKLDEAIGLIGGSDSMRSGEVRDRVFNTALMFAQKLAKEGRDASVALAGELFDRAGAAAGSASQKVNYRLSRAAFARQRSAPEQEIKLYQEILSDTELREVPVADLEGDATAANAIARRGIDDAIKRAGTADVYAPFERAAGELLATAVKGNDPEQLRAIAQAYPNSSAAPRALLAAADLYEAAVNPRRATQVLRQAYFRYPDNADRARIVESLARNYLLMPNRIDVAMARLNQGAKLPGAARLTKPLALPDGRIIQGVSFAEAAEVLKQFSAQMSSRDLPDIALPPLPEIRRTSGRVPAFLPEMPETILSGVGSLIVPAVEFSRNDRVVTFTPVSGVRVYAIGGTQPVMSSDAITQTPAGAAWVGPNLLVWTDTELFHLAGESGQLLWRTSLKSMPQIEVVAQATAPRDDDGDVPAAAADPVEQQLQDVLVGQGQPPRIIVRGGQQIIIQGGGRLRIVGRAAVPIQLQPPDPAPPGAEQIIHVRPLSDRVLLGTSGGRIVAVDLDAGKLQWQVRLSDRAASHLLANDDFAVARLADDNRLDVQLIVLDTFSGQVLSRRSFGGEAGVGMVPLNLSLAADGTLVFLMPDRLCGKDLFEPGGLDKLSYEIGNRRDGSMPFQASTGPEHLQIAGERIIVVGDNGASVRMHSLQTGELLKFNQSDAVLHLESAAGSGRIMLRSAGPRLYVATQREMRGYDLDRGTSWSIPIAVQTAARVRDLLVARGHVVALTENAGGGVKRQADQPTPMIKLNAFSRATDAKGDESGVFEHSVPIQDASGILKWQLVDGGMYYLSGDQRLHLLRGSRK